MEIWLAGGYFVYEDPGGWHAVPFDPSEVLLDMNKLGLLPRDVMNWLEHADEVVKTEDDELTAAYSVKPGQYFLQWASGQAQQLYQGEQWTKKQQALQELQALLASLQVSVVVSKETDHIVQVGFSYGGDISSLTGPLPPRVLFTVCSSSSPGHCIFMISMPSHPSVLLCEQWSRRDRKDAPGGMLLL